MEIKLANKYLVSVSEFLSKLKLSGKASRGRMKLNKAIETHFRELQEDIEQTKAEHKGDKGALEKALDGIENEKAILDLNKHKMLINELYISLDSTEVEMDGKEAVLHDMILDAIEDNHEDVTDQFTEVTPVEQAE